MPNNCLILKILWRFKKFKVYSRGIVNLGLKLHLNYRLQWNKPANPMFNFVIIIKSKNIKKM